MSLLYQPINMSPSNSTIDADEENDFTLTIRGTICVGYQLTIYNNSTGASVYTPAKVDISASPLYDNDTLTITVPVAATSGMVNGTQYKWSIDLYYDATHSITSREVVFNAYTTPTLALSVAATLNSQSHEFVPVYTQAEDVPITSFIANLYDSDGDPLSDSGTVYSANIRYTFEGFLNGGTYSVDFTATNQAGVTVTSNKETFTVSYSEPSLITTPAATNIEDSATVQINWGGAYQNLGSSTGTIEYIDNHIGGKFLHLEEESTAYWSTNVPADFTATLVFAPVVATLDQLYSCDSGDDLIYELDLDALTDLTGGGVIPPGTTVRGMGGIRNRIYIASLDELNFYELDPDTLANLSGIGVAVPGTSPRGVGGTDNQLFHCDDNAAKFYEIDPDTLANLSGAGTATPGSDPYGVGGMFERLFHCDYMTEKFYEIDPSTLANLSGTGTAVTDYVPMGIGGVSERLYCSGKDSYESIIDDGKLYNCDYMTEKFYEIDPSTLANLSGAGVSTPQSGADGVGGIVNKLYYCGVTNLYEIDPDTLANLSGVGVAAPAASYGIGGTSNKLYYCSLYNLYEIDPDTLANLSGAGVSAPGESSGIGGTDTRLYYCDDVSYIFYELDPDTLANLSGAVYTPGIMPSGVGGIINRLYNCDLGQTLYEIDPDTLANLSGAGVNSPGLHPDGIGGTKGSTSYLGRFYELDPNTFTPIGSGAVSQGLTPSDIGGLKGWSYTATLPYPLFDLTNSSTSDYLRITFRTDETDDYFYIQFAGHTVLFEIFDHIDVDEGVYFIAITSSYISIKQWFYAT